MEVSFNLYVATLLTLVESCDRVDLKAAILPKSKNIGGGFSKILCFVVRLGFDRESSFWCVFLLNVRNICSNNLLDIQYCFTLGVDSNMKHL